jgi:1-acyl-sn-glycerol-3-phosphate acyltransferase
MQPDTSKPAAGISADALLEIIRQLAAELSAQPDSLPAVTLDVSLERDLGLGSLARMELLARVERHFGLTFPAQAFTEADTPRDLLRALRAAQPIAAHDLAPEPAVPGPREEAEAPRHARTLIEALQWHVDTHPERAHIRLWAHDPAGTQTLTYRDLYAGAATVAGGLQRLGLRCGQAVAIMLPTGADYFFTFFGVLLAGGIPVPVYPPVRKSQLVEHLKRHQAILQNCGAPILVTIPEARGLARLLKSRATGLIHLTSAADLRAQSPSFQLPLVKAADTAFLQYTSGSTGNPKGVILSHANLLANIRSMGRAIAASSEDVVVSWLPLYHDMGLIGAWLSPLYYGALLISMSPMDFLARPGRWLRAIQRFGGTLSAAPNFGYEICLKRLADEDLTELDLSSWRCAFNGAEPVSPATLERFYERFKEYGLRREALIPVYGLAESTVGLAFPPIGRAWRVDHVDRATLMRSGQAREVAADAPQPLQFVSCGRPLAGHEVRIVDPGGRELPERRQGRLQFRGPSACSGYFRNPRQTQRLFQGDWLDSGDLAYLADGEIFITGRTKDVIICGGRNIYPEELEEAVGNLAGVRKGNVAVFGTPDPRTGTERLVVMAETRESGAGVLARLRGEIQSVALDLVGAPPDEIALVPPGSVLKTSSGKIRRAASRERFEKGRIGAAPPPLAWQLFRLWLSGGAAMVGRVLGRSAALAYGVYVWVLFLLLLPLLGLLAAVLPRLSWRWAAMRRGARLLFRAAGMPITVKGLTRLPAGPAHVVAANHASYLDGLVLTAALPEVSCFVAKVELTAVPGLHFMLRRLGTHFVERFDAAQGIEDARRIQTLLRPGQRLVYFPEGTFTRVAGLRPFEMGAFVAAAETGAPLVPVAIRGTRFALHPDTLMPRRGALEVHIGAPVEAPAAAGEDQAAWQRALGLRRQAREFILARCGEPDLAAEDWAPPRPPG